MRLDKYLADLNVGTRSEVKKILKQKRIFVNGICVSDAKFQVQAQDEVKIDNMLLHYEQEIYLLYYKPQGVVCANEDAANKTVFDMIHHPQIKQLFCVGRLDKDTTGALLITNDGQLDYHVRSKKYHVPKVYEVTLKNRFNISFIEKIEKGIAGYLPAKIQVIDDYHIQLTIIEGQYHQVKKMMIACENEVVQLHRSQFADLTLENLTVNTYRNLTKEEVRRLKQWNNI